MRAGCLATAALALWATACFSVVFKRSRAEGFSSETCTFNEDHSELMTRSASVNVNGRCTTNIVETQTSKDNDTRCRAVMEAIGFPERSSMQRTGFCALDNGILQDSDTASSCDILPTHMQLFRTHFDCSDNNNRLYDSRTGAAKVLAGIQEDKTSGRCRLTFNSGFSEADMRAYMDFLSVNSECGGDGA